jgi:hypothetical protein
LFEQKEKDFQSQKAEVLFLKWFVFIISNWFFMTPSIATKFQYINSL